MHSLPMAQSATEGSPTLQVTSFFAGWACGSTAPAGASRVRLIPSFHGRAQPDTAHSEFCLR
jgi:hypothetical protein